MNKENTFKVVDQNGNTIEFEILFTFESDETHKNYMVYTDNSIDNDGNTRVYASIYNPEEDEIKLEPIQTDKEWKIIETILQEIQASAQDMETNEQ